MKPNNKEEDDEFTICNKCQKIIKNKIDYVKKNLRRNKSFCCCNLNMVKNNKKFNKNNIDDDNYDMTEDLADMDYIIDDDDNFPNDRRFSKRLSKKRVTRKNSSSSESDIENIHTKNNTCLAKC